MAMLATLLSKLSWPRRAWSSFVGQATQAPLIDAVSLRDLATYAQSLSWSLLEFRPPAAHSLVGETLSWQRGRGFEFEENRTYRAGDDPRLLNWRLYARAGKLYTKVYIEERRPQVFIHLDRRAAMRFGTRRQLKVTLAAKLAICHAYQAQQQALPVGGLLLDQTTQWWAPALGEMRVRAFIEDLIAACPPRVLNADQASYQESLQLVAQRLPAGCFVLLLSDFTDLDPDTAMPILHQLASRHTLRAIQILDPVEQALPTDDDYWIDDPLTSQTLRLGSRDSAQHAHYLASFQDRQARLKACFKGCAIPFTCATTDADLQHNLGRTDAAERSDG